MSKIDKKTIVIIVLCCLLIWAGWTVFRGDVQHNTDGIDTIRGDISRIEKQQRDAINRIKSVENGLADSTSQLDTIQDRIGKIEKDLGSIAGEIEQSTERTSIDTGRIAEVQRILDDIRRRGQANGK